MLIMLYMKKICSLPSKYPGHYMLDYIRAKIRWLQCQNFLIRHDCVSILYHICTFPAMYVWYAGISTVKRFIVKTETYKAQNTNEWDNERDFSLLIIFIVREDNYIGVPHLLLVTTLPFPSFPSFQSLLETLI